VAHGPMDLVRASPMVAVSLTRSLRTLLRAPRSLRRQALPYAGYAKHLQRSRLPVKDLRPAKPARFSASLTGTGIDAYGKRYAVSRRIRQQACR
jgi:hypothetical protein